MDGWPSAWLADVRSGWVGLKFAPARCPPQSHLRVFSLVLQLLHSGLHWPVQLLGCFTHRSYAELGCGMLLVKEIVIEAHRNGIKDSKVVPCTISAPNASCVVGSNFAAPGFGPATSKSKYGWLAIRLAG